MKKLLTAVLMQVYHTDQSLVEHIEYLLLWIEKNRNKPIDLFFDDECNADACEWAKQLIDRIDTLSKEIQI